MLVFAAIASVLILLLEVQDGGRVALRFLPNRPLPEVCLSRRLLEIECPFCSLTRSLVLLPQGEWQRSLQMHRLGWLVAACVLFQFLYRIAALGSGRRFDVWHRLRVRPAFVARGDGATYSIGARNEFDFTVGNCHFFVLDTRGMRNRHDVDQPDRPGVSMIGPAQREWLLDGVRCTDTDFIFVVSTVSFAIPHVSPRQPDKDESWTAYLAECRARRLTRTDARPRIPA